jgi:hypothetical protein
MAGDCGHQFQVPGAPQRVGCQSDSSHVHKRALSFRCPYSNLIAPSAVITCYRTEDVKPVVEESQESIVGRNEVSLPTLLLASHMQTSCVFRKVLHAWGDHQWYHMIASLRLSGMHMNTRIQVFLVWRQRMHKASARIGFLQAKNQKTCVEKNDTMLHAG